MAAPLLGESELRFLRALLQRKVPFMLVGLSAAALQGAPVVTLVGFDDEGDGVGEVEGAAHGEGVVEGGVAADGLVAGDLGP